MKKLGTILFFSICLLTAVFTSGAFACATNEIDVLGDGTQCELAEFTITTTNLAANTEFWFSLSPKGSFVVDWGDGTVEPINRDNTTATAYTHTYATSGVKNIKICGEATEYNSSSGDNVVAAISFYTGTSDGSQTKIASVSGSLGAVFPTIGNGANANQQPRFRSTFQAASNLTSIPATLFSGVSGSADGMFRSTFDKCSKLGAIPAGLFANATGGGPNMFRSTFYECINLTEVPDNLFAGITQAKNNEFMYTFYGTTKLAGKYIPPAMFSGLINAGSPQNSTMWNQTFDASSGTGFAITCPARTSQYITGYEGETAKSTWAGHVSCEPSNPCTGAEYWDETNEVCTPCPTGYTDDTTDTKESINDCKIQCPAGKYLVNAGDAACSNVGAGYYAGASVVAYGSTSTRTQCPYNMPTLNNTTNATSESQCVVYCLGINYRDSSTNTCVACPTGYEYDTADGKTANTDCKINCAAGTYMPNANASSCTNVGDGYWSEGAIVSYGGTSTRNQCPNGEMTGTLTASSASQCIKLCTGATYQDSVTGMCVSCPVGYDAHTISGKTSANQCQIHCVAGTYIANAGDTVCTNVGDGYYASASNVNYGSVGTRTQCPHGHLTGTQTATDVSRCLTLCEGATYHDSTTGQCNDCPTGYTDNITDGKNSITQCQHYCAAGTYAETYTPITYISSTNSKQFIDMRHGITATHVYGTVVVEAKSTVSGANGNAGNFFGNMYGTQPYGFSANFKGGNFGVWLQLIKGGDKAKYPGNGSAVFAPGTQYTVEYDITMTGGSTTTANLTVNGASATPKTLDNVIINAAGNHFKLFSNGATSRVGNELVSSDTGDILFSGRMYSLTLYEDDTLVFDLVPVRRESDGALGMFNRVNNEFYENSGLGSFSAGPDNGNPFVVCVPVGNGYYVDANYTNFGSFGTRNQCPNGADTTENGVIIDNATNIYQCSGVVSCTGAEYPDATTGICTPCPTGYSANVQNNKKSVFECQISCSAGTYLANAYDTTCSNAGNGYYAGAATINWGNVGTRTRCSNGGATNTETASDASACQAVAACTGATYMNFGVCTPCPTGYDAHTASGKTSVSDCQLVCPEGSYLATANDTTCTDAGAGYWATGGAVNYGSTSTHITCPEGLTTVGYGHGADEIGDCGRKLHVNNYILYSKTTKPTTPAINIQPLGGNTVFYVGVSDTNHNLTPLHVTQGNLQYTAFDDSILYGERDFETNTRITQ